MVKFTRFFLIACGFLLAHTFAQAQVNAVEFGKKVVAKSILAGGNSGNPKSKHFNDQAEMFTKGEFKDVLFYKEDVVKNAERRYQPGN